MAWNGIGNALSGFNTYLEQKPEQFAIMADALGRGFDPNNAFAGIGTAMGKSSLANKARNEQQTMLARLLSGQPTGTPKAGMVQPQTNPLTPQQLAAGSAGSALAGQTQVPMPNGNTLNFLTPGHQTGPTGISYTRKPDGSLGMSLSGLAEPAPTAAQKNPTMRPTDLINFSQALSGSSDLTGLSPAEIGAISSRDVDIANLGRKTMADLSNVQYNQGRIKAAMATADSTNKANMALSLQRRSKAAMNAVEAAIKQKKAPAEIAKLRANAEKLSQESSQIELDIANDWEKVKAMEDLGRVGWDNLREDQKARLLGTGLASSQNNFVTQQRLAQQDAINTQAKRTKAYADAVNNIYSNDGEATIGDISMANQNSPDTSTDFFRYTGNTGWGDGKSDNTPERVQLPKVQGRQVTMKDLRFNAQKYGISLEDAYQHFMNRSK